MALVVVLLVLATVVDAAPQLSRSSPWNIRSLTDSRIINGQNAAKCQFPHQVSLQINKKHFCGGSIIGKEWVVTAAHCALYIHKYRRTEEMRVVVGTNNLSDVTTTHRLLLVGSHYLFNLTGHLEYDYGMIQVYPPFDFNDCVKPITLGMGQPSSGMKCYASGWGRTSGTPGDHTMPENLKFTMVTPLADSECKKKIYLYKDEAVICTIGSGVNGACNGDSGGPLTCYKNGTDPQLYGIDSFSIYNTEMDCRTDYPNGWADAASDYGRKWISGACRGCV